MALKDKISTLIRDEQKRRPTSGIGFVVSSDTETFTCSVMYVTDENPSKPALIQNVELPMINGMSYSMPKPGDKVLLNFLEGNIYSAVVVATYPTTERQIDNLSFIPNSVLTHLSKIR